MARQVWIRESVLGQEVQVLGSRSRLVCPERPGPCRNIHSTPCTFPACASTLCNNDVPRNTVWKTLLRSIPEKLDFLLDVCPSARTWLMLRGLPYQSPADRVAGTTGMYCLSLGSGGRKSTVKVSAGLGLSLPGRWPSSPCLHLVLPGVSVS